MIEQVIDRFSLGRVVEPAVAVPGGLSNELWRVRTDRATYAIKRMVVNAHRPDFVNNVEAAFVVESRAYTAGIAMPAPIPVPDTGRALARVDGELVRVHRWVSGTGGEGSAVEAVSLLAQIHTAGNRRWSEYSDDAWLGEGWGDDIAAMAQRAAVGGPSRVLIVDSHRDLDRKNTLRRSDDGALIALDWDAAGVTCVIQEAVAVALDWAGVDPEEFRTAIAAYQAAADVVVPAQAWVFAGWIAGQGGWLDYNAASRADNELGRNEATGTLGRLRQLSDHLDVLLDGLG